MPKFEHMPDTDQMSVGATMPDSEKITASYQNMCTVPTFETEEGFLSDDKKIPVQEQKRRIRPNYRTEN